MNEYTLLLVDDEEEVISVIIKKINWEELGFRVIGYADNGVKGLEMVEKYEPDVVMTDIRMPYMDGLEMTRLIRERFPETKVLFFTGFDEFTYAKEAVHLEAWDYILKPINSMELRDVYTKLKEKLDSEINEKRNVESLQKYYMESLPLLRENFYSALIEGKLGEEEIGQYLKEYQISFDSEYYGCIVVHGSAANLTDQMNATMLNTFIKKNLMDYFGEDRGDKCFIYLDNTVMLLPMKNENDIIELTDECERFCRYANRILGLTVTIGIGQVCSSMDELNLSYEGAREAISYRVIYGNGKAINIKEIEPKKSAQPRVKNDTVLAELFKAIRLAKTDEIEGLADSYFSHVTRDEDATLQNHQIVIMDLVSELYRFSMNNEIDVNEMLGDMQALCNKLLDMDYDMLQKWLCDVARNLSDRFVNARGKISKSIVRDATEYVKHHYMDENLSLDTICEELNISNAYFSSLFKKETGKTFVAYVTDYRMEEAARLLLETDEKKYVIAERVGYTDANYFSYVFKRQFGVSPSKYRMEYMKNEK